MPNLGLKKAIEEFSQDPAGQKVLEELSLREDGQEPAFPGGDAGGEGGADGEEEATNVELLIVGPSGVGKSSLLRRIRDGEFSDVMDSTIGLDYETKKVVVGNKPCSVKIWDTSGQPLFRHTIQTQYRRADVIMFVYDVTRPETLEKKYLGKAYLALLTPIPRTAHSPRGPDSLHDGHCHEFFLTSLHGSLSFLS